MRNIFIHIGIGKTATTTLQVESFPKIARFKGLTFLTLQDLLEKYRIERTNYKIHPLEGVEHKLKDLNNVIISCESFVGRDFNPYYFKNAMEINKKIFGNDITIIITIRKPSDLFTSYYIQKIQEGSTCKVKELLSKDLHPEKYQISNNFYTSLISMYKENFDRVLIVKFDEIKKFNFLDTLIDLDSTQKKLLSTSFEKKIYNKSYSKFALNLSLIISKVSSIISIKQPKIKLPKKKNFDKKGIGPLSNFYNKIMTFFSVRKILHSLDQIIPYKKYQINFHEIGFPEIDQINQKYEEYDDIQLFNSRKKTDVKSKYSSDVKEVILNENSEPKLKTKHYYKKTLFILKGTNFKLLPIFTIILFAGVIDLISIGMIGPLIGSVANPNFIEDSNLPFNIDLVEYSLENVQTYLFIIISSLFIIRGIVSMYLNFKIVQFSYKQDVILKNKLMKNYINMPLSKFTKRNRSEYFHSINYLSSQFTSQIIMSILQTVSSVIIGLILLILLAATNLKLLLIAATFFIFIIIAYDLLIKKRLKEIGILFNLFSTRMYKAMNEGLDGFKEIRIYRKESYFLDLFKKSSERSAKYQILNNVFSLLPRYMFESFIILLGVLSVYLILGSKMPISNSVQILGIFTVAAIRLIPMLTQLTASLNNMRFAKDGIDKIYNDLKNNETYESSKLNRELINDFENISIKNISYKYDKESMNVLSNVSLEIERNKFIGIRGKSGSGKSTLVNCIVGLLKADSGSISIERPDGSKVGIENSVLNIAYIPQQLFFIDGSIIENITLESHDHEIDYELLNSTVRKMNLIELIDSLPEGIHTNLGERGVKLSGGQIQRIALARALYSKKNLIVMDESTNSLDVKTEDNILRELKAISQKITLIFISHRPQSLNICDEVFTLEDGKLLKRE